MAWIESHQALERHYKTHRLAGAMGWDLDTTLGKLHRFWWWCVDYAEDGDLRKHNDAVLGGAVGLNGPPASVFVEAMVASCWIDREPYFRVHDWWDYIGRFLQVKYNRRPDKWRCVQEAYCNPCSNPCSTQKQANQPTKASKPPAPALAREEPPPSAAASPLDYLTVLLSEGWTEEDVARAKHTVLTRPNPPRRVSDWAKYLRPVLADMREHVNGRSDSKADDIRTEAMAQRGQEVVRSVSKQREEARQREDEEETEKARAEARKLAGKPTPKGA